MIENNGCKICFIILFLLISSCPGTKEQLVPPEDKAPDIFKKQLPWTKPQGLANQGNSCYFNGMMQTLLNSEASVLGILGYTKEKRDALSDDDQKRLDALREFLDTKLQPNVSASMLGAKAAPIIKSFGFSCAVQSDAEEIGRPILELAQVPKIKVKESTELYKNDKKEKEIVKYIEEFMLNIVLPNPIKLADGKYKELDLQNVIDNFSSIEDNREPDAQIYLNEDTQEKSDRLTRRFQIAQLQNEIFLHLGRFFWPNFAQREKIKTPLLLPDNQIIDLNKIVLPEINAQGRTRYRLSAITVHMGGLEGGHYIAFVRYGDQWWHCNDSICDKIYYQKMKNDPALLSGSYVLLLDRL